MIKRLVTLLALLSFFVPAQAENNNFCDSTDQGIIFQQDKSWKEVIAKAKSENKFIFVDCYATWCGPCKEMEKNVYPLEKVGDTFNSDFISIKFQMDSSAKDDARAKKQYADAHFILTKYKIEGYPTYLFFTPDGKIIDRDAGAKSPEEFIAIGKNAADPGKNYYKILSDFEKGKRDMDAMSFLARRGLLLGDTVNSQKAAQEYIKQLKDANLLTQENIDFMKEFTGSSRDKGFSFFYNHEQDIDSVMNDDTYAEGFIQGIIYREMVAREIKKSKKSGVAPDWEAIQAAITSRFNSYYGERAVISAQSSWADPVRNAAVYTKSLVLFQDRYGSKKNEGIWQSFILNNYAWAIFLYSNNKSELERALSWSSRAVMMNPNAGWMDTYANLLYKLGRKDEALKWEDVAIKLGRPEDKYLQENLEKMKRNLPTWTIK